MKIQSQLTASTHCASIRKKSKSQNLSKYFLKQALISQYINRPFNLLYNSASGGFFFNWNLQVSLDFLKIWQIYLVNFQKIIHISSWVSHFRYMDGTMWKFRSVRTLGYHSYTGSGTPRKKYDFLKFFDLAYQNFCENCSAILIPDLSWVRIPL